LINVLISGSQVGIRSDGLGVVSLQKVLIADDVLTKTVGFGAGGLTGTPLTGAAGFVGGGDYRLAENAPALNQADAVPGITVDLDGVSRPQGVASDIGAYERPFAKQDQSISFDPLLDRGLAESPFNLQATATPSFLPVSFASQTPGVCLVNVATVTLVATGTCTIQATQPGDGNFNPATPVTRSFTVSATIPEKRIYLPGLQG
jgi:hypothetical protein